MTFGIHARHEREHIQSHYGTLGLLMSCPGQRLVEPSDFCGFGAEKAGRRSAADCAGSAGQGGYHKLELMSVRVTGRGEV